MKTLIACPAAATHDYPLEHWLWWVYEQNTHKDFTALICLNGEVPDGYIERLQAMNEKLMIIDSECKSPIIHERLAKSRQAIMDYAIKWNYDQIFWLDMDTIPLIRDIIPMLQAHNKPLMCGWYAYKSNQAQIVATKWIDESKQTARGMILQELKDHAAKDMTKPIRLAGVGFGCVLMQKELFDIPFRYEHTEHFEQGEDIAFCEDALKRKNVRPYMDVRGVCKHLSIEDVGVQLL